MIRRADPRAHVASVTTAFPETIVDQHDAIRTLRKLFPEEDVERIENLVRRSGIEKRYISSTLEEVLDSSSFTRRNADYHVAAVELALRASSAALVDARVEPGDIDVLIDVSCTGISIPAVDVSLAPLLGLRPDVRRVPITESGCAAGALALCLAESFARAGQSVLIVAVELCSLSLCPGDRTRTNLVASALFGDGAAAAVVLPEAPGVRIEAVRSHLIPETRAVMGFEVGSHGMRIVLERELPGIVAAELPRAVESFLRSAGREPKDIALHLVHPGGKKILEAYEQRFGLGENGLVHSRSVLSECGNLSSASILAVFERALLEGRGGRAEEALLVAIGPGLSLEMALLDFEPARRSS